jgi:excisionase family DNA binding protein
MSITIRRKVYYQTSEACEMAGVSRSTLLRWIRDGVLEDVSHRDRRGWRLFSEADIKRIEEEVHKLKQGRWSQMG